MSHRIRRTAYRTAHALLVALALLLSPVGGSTSHDPIALQAAEAARHGELAVETHDHGHTHDDGTDDERVSGHTHGHNAADHSHGAATTPEQIEAVGPRLGHRWLTSHRAFPCPQPCVRLDRPPRLHFIA